jgi:lysophospholipase L1-like esterase
MPQMLVFGDSISAGAIDPEGGWVVRLRNYLIKNGYIDWSTFLYNLAVDVDNSSTVLSRIDFETKCRSVTGERKLFIFSFGLHDTCFFKDGKMVTDKKKFESNVRSIISWQKKVGGDAFFVGITPVYERKTRPVSYSTTGKNFSNEKISEYNSILKKVCSEEKIIFVDVFERMLENSRNLFIDGVYPNNKAHGIILKSVIEQLEKSELLVDWPKRNWSTTSVQREIM